MGQITRRVGEIMFLQFQLEDLEASMPLRVFSELLDSAGTILSTVELTHTSKGVFLDSVTVMPAETVVYVKSYVYGNDGVTLNLDYTASEERYMQAANIIVGGELSSSVTDSSLVATLSELDDLTGSINSDETLKATISDATVLTGEVSNE